MVQESCITTEQFVYQILLVAKQGGFMKDFIITTDTTTDLPASYVNEHHLGMMSLPYTIENQTYTWEHSLPEKDFYAMMRKFFRYIYFNHFSAPVR